MKLNAKETCIFGLLGALMYASKAIMAMFPNIHLVGVFIVAITIVYRKKALYPIYIFVFLSGMIDGFGMWWLPYLYIWLPLWGATMILPKQMKVPLKQIVYMSVCSLHGFLYGILYAPAQALLFGLSFEGMIAWLVAGFPFDVTHGISNFICGMLICPLIRILEQFGKTGKK